MFGAMMIIIWAHLNILHFFFKNLPCFVREDAMTWAVRILHHLQDTIEIVESPHKDAGLCDVEHRV